MRLHVSGADPPGVGITALLGPTNTGKTHRAIERMLAHRSGMIGLPLRLLAREVYDRVTARIGEQQVALVTGEEKRIPARPRYWVCTVESMPEHEVDFVAVDEIQLAAHHQRGHTFTDRLLHARGRHETWFLGADTMRPLLEELVPTAIIEGAPRLSRLRYTGTHGQGSLPARTAVVAFSAEDVYALAEALRRQHGGTAVVLGALSPRTRNAQVAMYQAGEVHHLVATDAIGMGLNLDVDRVVFASLHKFDGRERRPLELAELGQIAGRAGRHTRDGGFGTLRPLTGLPASTVEAMERHRFETLHRLVWRSRELSFASVSELLGSLRQRPPRRSLRLVEHADDYEALVRLSRLDAVQRRARSPEAIELLWEVCRIPDYRKLLVDSHVQLLAAIYEQLAGPAGRLDEDWIAHRIRRLDDSDGDIDTLMTRIAFVRTWTYVTHHEHWVPNAAHWQELTRQIEDRHSDALHERLTARFVEHRGEARRSGRSRRVRRPRPAPPLDPEVVERSPFRALLDLPVPEAPGMEAPDAQARAQWVQGLVDAEFGAFAVDDEGMVIYEQQRVGRLERGAELLHPVVRAHERPELGAGAQRRIERRLQAWGRDLVEGLLAPLRVLHAQPLGAAARGLLYQLEQGLGTITRAEARSQLQGLAQEDRQRLLDAGVELGHAVVYVPAMLDARALRWRAALVQAWWSRPVPVLPPAAVSVPAHADVPPEVHLWLGRLVVAGRAVRVDQLERAHAALRAHGSEPFVLPPELGAWLGCRRGRLPGLLRAMGYRPVDDGRWVRARGRGRRRGSRRAPPRAPS
ncbi:helicase-related protein [Paraliomyxa miuraensis]|uniref:helicase-related protein n=1 Tax=Paraliomyxa miuraensis TaxID=376150 RepID=UPI0022590C35|nr:helicase-related protein [Paraliomyxa miuraensis]MCX4246092.1 helicase-related protein [Paraliomyxa miuraensis]